MNCASVISKVFLDRWYLVRVGSGSRPWKKCLTIAMPLQSFLVRTEWARGSSVRKSSLQSTGSEIPTLPVIPVLLAGADPALGFLQLYTWVDLQHGPTPEAIEVLVRAAHGQAPGRIWRSASPALATICPYRGLRYFREEDEPFFCGRESFTESSSRQSERAA